MADTLVYAQVADVVAFLNARRAPRDGDWTAAVNDGLVLLAQQDVDDQIQTNMLPILETELKVDPSILSTYQQNQLIAAVSWQVKDRVLLPASKFQGDSTHFSADALQALANARLATPIVNAPLLGGLTGSILNGDLAGSLQYGEYRSVGSPYYETGSEPWYPSNGS